MALELKIRKQSISNDCLTLIIDDQTGAYDAVSNPTGFGAPNPERVDMGLITFLVAKRSTGDEFITLALDDADPHVTVDWTATHGADTVYKAIMYGVDNWDSGVTYVLDEVVFNDADNLFYKSLSASNLNKTPASNPADWEATVVFADFETAIEVNAQANCFFDEFYIFENCNTEVCLNRKLLSANCACQDPCALGVHRKIQLKLEGALIHFGLTNYTKAQELLENASVTCANDTSNCNC